MGYVGLPLVLRFGAMGFQVLGFDTDANKVELLNRGESYFKHIPSSQLAPLRYSQAGASRFSATHDMGRLGEPDILIICVPTPLTAKREPDIQYVDNTTRLIAANLRPSQLVSLESTTYPGTTVELLFCLSSARGSRLGKIFISSFLPSGKIRAIPTFR
jgi:UDP-N-acetyl-D-glucosamine dehydrogenase